VCSLYFTASSFTKGLSVSMYCGQYILFYRDLIRPAARHGLSSGASLNLIEAARKGSDQPNAALVDYGPSQALVKGGPRVNGKFAAEAVVPHIVDHHGINNLRGGSLMFEC
jgi:hypothetical protein